MKKFRNAILLMTAALLWLFPGSAMGGWQWMNPLPQGGYSLGVWGSGPGDVFVTLYAGGIIHFDGSSWQPSLESSDAVLCGIWGSGSEDVFAVGYVPSPDLLHKPVILHYDGRGWAPMDLPISVGGLWKVWGSSSTDVYATGIEGSLLHYDGESWYTIALNTQRMLGGIWGSSARDIYASGDQCLFHWDGAGWSEIVLPVSGRWSTIWGSGLGDVFILGNDEQNTGHMLHFDGESWSAMQLPVADGLTDLWGSSGNDVYAITSLGAVLHYDGNTDQAWTKGEEGLPRVSRIWGSSATDIFLAGSGSTIVHYDGSSWSLMSIRLDMTMAFGAWGTAYNDLFVVGMGGQGYVIYHYDGAEWNLMTSSRSSLFDIWGTSSSNVFAVGLKTYGALILHYDGTQWTEMPVPDGAGHLWAVWGSSEKDVFAVGWDSTVLHYDGSQWSRMEVPPEITGFCFTDVTGTSSDNIVAVAKAVTESKGYLLHYDGTSWRIISEEMAPAPKCVWAASARDFFVGTYASDSSAGKIFHYDGVSWMAMPQPEYTFHEFICGIWGKSLDDLYILGGTGTFFHFNGTRWSRLNDSLMGPVGLNNAFALSSQDVYATGFNGAILNYRPAMSLAVSVAGEGLWHYLSGRWTKLSAQLPRHMVSVGEALAVSYPGEGIYRYDLHSWTRLGASPTVQGLLGVDDALYLDSGPFGLYRYTSRWQRLTTEDPKRMAPFRGGVATASKSGISWFDGSKRKLLSRASDAQGLLAVSDALYADRGKSGLWGYDGRWHRLSPANPSLLGQFRGHLLAAFKGAELTEYSEAGASDLAPPARVLALSEAGGVLYATLQDRGLWKFDGSSWTQIHSSSPTTLEACGDVLAAGLGDLGLWLYDGRAWSLLKASPASALCPMALP